MSGSIEESQGLFGGQPQRGSMGRIGEDPNAVNWRNFICKSQHPAAAFFHLAFKGTAFFLYVFGGWISVDYVTSFVLSVLLLAFDFWTVKNVTGRLLVGLRWWVHVNPEDGSNQWHFESNANVQVPSLDYRIFWWALYGAPFLWSIFGLLAFISLKLDWLLITLVGAGLTGSNLMGYMKCSSDAQKRLSASLTAGALQGLSYIPGAIPALGSTLMGVISGQAMSAMGGGGSAGGQGAGAVPAGGARTPSSVGASAPVDTVPSPFASVGDEKVTI